MYSRHFWQLIFLSLIRLYSRNKTGTCSRTAQAATTAGSAVATATTRGPIASTTRSTSTTTAATRGSGQANGPETAATSGSPSSTTAATTSPTRSSQASATTSSTTATSPGTKGASCGKPAKATTAPSGTKSRIHWSCRCRWIGYSVLESWWTILGRRAGRRSTKWNFRCYRWLLGRYSGSICW